MTEHELRQTILEVGRRLYDKGYVAANDGNISVRLADGRVLTTPTGYSKGFMEADSLAVVDLEGHAVSGAKASSELPLHLFIYKARPDVMAVVHAHPPYATGFATAGVALDKCVLAEIIVTMGSIPLAKYGTPSTDELPKSIEPYIQTCDALLLTNHGVVTVGKDLMDAQFKMERVEHSAHILFNARALGGETVLSKDEVTKLYGLRDSYGASTKNPGCYVHGNDDDQDCNCSENIDDFEAIVEQVLQAVTRK